MGLCCPDGDCRFPAHGTQGVNRVCLAAKGFFRVHDSLAVKRPQSVGYNTLVVGRNTRQAFGIVLQELSDLFIASLFAQCVVRFIVAQHAVVFGFKHGIAFEDGEVEWCCQVGISPRLSLFYFKAHLPIAWHKPYNDRNGDQYQCHANGYIAPGDIDFQIETIHFSSL